MGVLVGVLVMASGCSEADEPAIAATAMTAAGIGSEGGAPSTPAKDARQEASRVASPSDGSRPSSPPKTPRVEGIEPATVAPSMKPSKRPPLSEPPALVAATRLLGEAENALKKGDLVKARELLGHLLRADPGHPDGNVLLDSLDAASRAVVVEVKPPPKSHVQEAQDHINAGRLEEGVQLLAKISAESPDRSAADRVLKRLATHEVHNTAGDPSEPWLNLRSHAAPRSGKVGQMFDGTRVRRLGGTGVFWKVIIVHGDSIGRVGFAHSKWLRPATHVGK